MENALVILCGGNSTRMGTDKALLPFGDTCLIEYLVRKFQPYFSRIYLSVKIKGDYSHLKLPVTEIPDIYPNQGPMSGIFSGLSMIDEECAFFMSVDTPFLEPKTGLALLSELGDADICTLEGKASYLETATAAYSKNCITTIGKCLLLHQLTFNTLREKCSTRYVTEAAIAEAAPTPIDIQYYNLDTRDNYYHALRILSGIVPPDSSQALIEYFKDTRDLFLHTTPVISFVAKPGTIMTPLIERLLPLLEREGLKVVHLIKEAVRSIRNVRTGMNVPPSKKAKVFVVSEDEAIRETFENGKVFFGTLGYASEVVVQADKAGIDEDAVSAVTSKAVIYMPFAELVDIEKEVERLHKEEEKLNKELARVKGMLSNERFVSKAPESKVAEEKAKLEKYTNMMEQVKERLKQLEK